MEIRIRLKLDENEEKRLKELKDIFETQNNAKIFRKLLRNVRL